MFAKMKLRQRILLGYLVPFVLLLAVMGSVYVNARNSVHEIDELNETAPVVADVLIAAGSLVRMQRASYAYILTNGGAYSTGSTYPKKIYEASWLRFQEQMKRIEPLAGKIGQQEKFRQMAALGNNIYQVTQRFMTLIDEGSEKSALTEMRRGESIQLAGQLDPLIDDIVKAETARRDVQRAELTAAIGAMQNTVVAGTFLAMALMVGFGLWLGAVVGRDIFASGAQLSAAASEIAATIAEHERTASQQAAAASETSATIAQLSASARQSAEQAANAAAVAERAGAATTQGDEATSQAVAAMVSLKTRIDAMAEQILHLGEQTGQIGSTATVLKDLAGQINMLALNAAVEAARAGEHGKGFAVVASEIRKLADESKKSAEQTAVLVADIQKATNATIMMTEEGNRNVAEVTQKVQKVAELFNNLASLAGSANENAQQVMLNAKQQSAAFNQVVEATNSIVASAKETAVGISQTKTGVQSLNEAAVKLKAIV